MSLDMAMENGKRAGMHSGIYRREPGELDISGNIWHLLQFYILHLPWCQCALEPSCTCQNHSCHWIRHFPFASPQLPAQSLLLHLRLRPPLLLQFRHDAPNSAFSGLHLLTTEPITCSIPSAQPTTSSHQQTRRIMTPALSCLSLRPHGEASPARPEYCTE